MPSDLTIVFDLDGTLADTAHDLVRTLNVVLDQEGLDPIPLKDARDLIGAGAKPLIARGLELRGKQISAQRLDSLYHYFLDHYHANIAVETRLFPGVIAALDLLAADGARLAVCTNKLEGHAVKLLETLGISRRFAAITGKDTFSFFKPDARHLTETVRKAGGDPARAVMVGDSMTDIETARNAALPVVAVSFGYTQTPPASFNADVLIDHFDALASAIADVAGSRLKDVGE